MNSLEEYIGKGYKVSLDSSTFKELTKKFPSISIWSFKDIINVASKSEYGSKRYYNRILKLEEYFNHIADVTDYDKVLEIYKICASSYTTTDDEKIIKMHEALNSKKLTHK